MQCDDEESRVNFCNRCNINIITKIKDNIGQEIENPNQIVETFVKYHSNILNNYEYSNLVTQKKMLKLIPRLLTNEDNKYLNKKISMEEINEALFSLNPDKSLGSDGFQDFFFFDP